MTTDILTDSGAEGVLIVLPRADAAVNDEELREWRVLEKWMLTHPVPLAVFYTEDSEQVALLEQKVAKAEPMWWFLVCSPLVL